MIFCFALLQAARALLAMDITRKVGIYPLSERSIQNSSASWLFEPLLSSL